MYVTHDIWTQVHNYNCEKFRRNVYLVFRAVFSCWSCFLILLYCSAGCHFIPIHQDFKSSCLNKIHVLFMKINWLVWLVFNMYQYIILLSCIYMYKVRCTCDGLHIWKLTVKPLCAAPTSCKWLTPKSNHQSKTKKITIKSIHYSWNLSKTNTSVEQLWPLFWMTILAFSIVFILQ